MQADPIIMKEDSVVEEKDTEIRAEEERKSEVTEVELKL